mmetsp:Transcript_9428/g.16424  ORF Transcript_9428/g.16424 Transcript_9428/m.16424 type:complete len:179 (+) Transcript_9428:3-539(+)
MLPLLLQSESGDSTATTSSTIQLTPPELITEIDQCNQWIYELINNGVYRCGFSTSQRAYEQAAADVSRGLDKCERILLERKYLLGEQFTESDIMLLPTMLRFDGVYAPLFGAGSKLCRLECDYPAIFQWMKRCWNEIDGVSESIDVPDACESYYKQLFPLNPGGILPTPVTAQRLRLQ